uniref:Oxygenase MpaB family protein n=1 Tax=Roseihalotalea indica TaxID=2867963 RepID=A0AA49JGP5_9BACT|nr:oxygenase MpaB family protein [Tunicatimonas sp. TK19036]
MSKLKFYDNAFLDAMRQQTDPLADQAIADLMQNKQLSQYREIIQALTTNSYELPKGLPDSVVHFFESTRKLPTWADETLIRQGQQFFEKNISDLLLMLALLSLPYDYASAKGVQVLYLSKRLRHNPAKRLAETGQYLLDVGEKNGFSPQGKAICSAQKVRLTHAAVRYHILRGEEWDETWGSPVNQEDMAGTNLSMSLLPIRGMRKIGITVSQEEANSYVHLWNVASFIMGVDERLLPDNSKEAFWLTRQIAKRQHSSSEAGRALTQSLLTVIPTNKNFDGQGLATRYMRFLLGDETADILALPSTSIPDQWLTAPLKGFSQLRQWMGSRAQQYYDTRQRLMRQIKQTQAQPFAVPSSLKT